MTEHNIKNALIQEIDALQLSEQQLVLEFARSLHSPLQKGASGHEMAVQSYGFRPEDISEMEQAILEGCEKIDSNEW